MNDNKIIKVIKIIFVAISIAVLLLAFSSSYTSSNIDNLAFVIAIAIDNGSKDNTIQVSFQIGKPSSISESGSSENDTSIINTVESNSISSAINLLDSYIGKEVNLSHCKLIIFSEEIATNGISDKIYTLVNDIQIRPSTNIIISKTNAKYYLENSEPNLESLPTKYYEIFPNSNKYTGYVSNVTIGDFFGNLSCDTCEPYAILGGILDNNQNNIKANDFSITGKRDAENIGLAVFKGDKVVGELTAIETLCFSIIKDNVNGFLVTIKDPTNEEKYMDIYLYHNSNTKKKVEIINGSPYITINCKFDGRIYSMENDAKYVDESILKNISQAVSKYMELQIQNYLYKTSKKFKSDINGFGVSSYSKFTTLKELEEYDWNKNYENSFFTVNADVNVKSGFLLTET